MSRHSPVRGRRCSILSVSVTIGQNDSPYTTELTVWPSLNKAHVVQKHPSLPDELIGGEVEIPDLLEILQRIAKGE